MTTVLKQGDNFYLKIMSTDDKAEFNTILLICRKFGLKFDSEKKAYTSSNPKILVDVLHEINDNFETFISSDTLTAIENYNPYIPSFSPVRRKLNMSFFEKFPPKGQYQIDDVRKMVCYGRILNASKMGLGKTYVAIQTINQLVDLGLADRVLIVTIPSTLYNWKYEILNFSDLFKEEDILIITEANRQKFFEKDLPNIVIVSYSTLRLCSDYKWRLDNPFKTPKDTSKLAEAKKKYREQLNNYRKEQIDFSKWGNTRILIADEVHTAKNMDTRWTSILHKEKKYFDFRYGLSGTPAPNGVWELYSPIKLLDDFLVDNSYVEFLRTIGTVGTKYSSYALDSVDEEKAKNLYDRIKPYFIRRFLRDHIDLPQVLRKNIYIDFDGWHKQIYQNVVNESLTAIKEEKGVILYKDIQMKFPYILQAISDPFLLENKIVELNLSKFKFSETLKFVALKNLVEDILSEDKKSKILIWGIHPKTLDKIAIEFSKYKPMVIHGENTPKGQEKNKWRDQEIRNFKVNDSQIMIANPSVIGTGQNISFVNAMIHYDRDFNYTVNEQSDGRLERIGLNEEAVIYYLIVTNSLEIHLEKALENKKLVDDLFLSTGALTNDKVKDIFNSK